MKTAAKLLSLFIATFVVVSVLLFAGVSAVIPFGADIVENVTSRAPTDNAESHDAFAGNVTYLTIFGYTVTQSWQGYYGNVSGTISLEDGDGNVFYNWSLADPSGEVYATENSTVSWVNIACYNLSDNTETLETWFNISHDDVDGVNETFFYGNSHRNFYTANTYFAEGTCATAYLFNDTGLQGGVWEQVLLTDQSDDVQIIFTSIIEEGGAIGFDGSNYDFQMLVLEDGHGTDTDARPYYFYVELQ